MAQKPKLPRRQRPKLAEGPGSGSKKPKGPAQRSKAKPGKEPKAPKPKRKMTPEERRAYWRTIA